MSPQLIFGTASFGMTNSSYQDVDSVTSVLQLLRTNTGKSDSKNSHGGKDVNNATARDHVSVHRLDTAARYPPNDFGRSETLIGEAAGISHEFVIDTKVLTGPNADGAGDLSLEAVDRSVEESLKRLKVNSVNILYAHRPDLVTPIEEQVRAFNKQIDAGKAKEYGLSNHSVDQIEAFLRVCEEKGLRKPSVFQGDYNILTRGMETKLLPLLRKHDMRYHGFRPIAAGLLSGKLISGQIEGTRFSGDGALAAGMRKVFGSDVLHETVRQLQESLSEHGLSGIEVGLRWLYYHSPLTTEDGIILGASRNCQIEENLQTLREGPLPSAVLQLVDQSWTTLHETRGSIL